MKNLDLRYIKNFGLYNLTFNKNDKFISHKNIFASNIKNLFKKNVIKILFEKKLIDNLKLVELSKNEIKIIYPKFYFPFYLNELPPNRRNLIANFNIELLNELKNLSLTLSSNGIGKFYLDNSGIPFFYDLSSIVKLTDNNENFYSSFLQTYINPINVIKKYPSMTNLIYQNSTLDKDQMMIINQPLKRKILIFILTVMKNIFNKKIDVINYLNSSNKFFLLDGWNVLKFHKFFNTNSKLKINLFLIYFKKQIKKIKNIKLNKRWTSYYDHIDLNKLVYEADLSQFKTNDRDKNILTIISESKNKSLLDIGCNSGYFQSCLEF